MRKPDAGLVLNLIGIAVVIGGIVFAVIQQPVIGLILAIGIVTYYFSYKVLARNVKEEYFEGVERNRSGISFMITIAILAALYLIAKLFI